MNVIYPRTFLNSTRSDRNVNWSESGFKSRIKPVIGLSLIHKEFDRVLDQITHGSDFAEKNNVVEWITFRGSKKVSHDLHGRRGSSVRV